MNQEEANKFMEDITKNPSILRALGRARIKNNIVYVLLSVCSDLCVDIDKELHPLKKKLKSNQRLEIGMLATNFRNMKYRFANLCNIAWKDSVQSQVDLSDNIENMKRLIVTIVSKCGKDQETFSQIIKMIDENFKTKLPLKQEDFE